MQRTLNQLLKDAVERKPRRLSFDTKYSHDNIYDWLKTILSDWTIIIPKTHIFKCRAQCP